MLTLPSLYKIKDILQRPFTVLDSDLSSSEQLLKAYLSYRTIGQPFLTELLKYIPNPDISSISCCETAKAA